MFTNFKQLVMRGRNLNRLSVLALLLILLGGGTLLHLSGITPLVQAQQAQCDIFGIINSDRTLGPTAEGCDIYNIKNNLVVNTGITLTIEPGTTLRFDGGKSMTVRGTLLAQGTETAPVVLTSAKETPGRGDWGQLSFESSSGSSMLRHTTVEYGQGIKAESASPQIEYATIRYHAASGVYLRSSASTITHSSIMSNTASSGAGMEIYYGSVTLDANIISWNQAATRGGGIRVYGYPNGVSITVTNNLISHNTVGSYGGGGMLFDGADSAPGVDALIEGNTFSDNVSTSGTGGGLQLGGAIDPRIILRNNTIVRNSAVEGGGIRTDARVIMTGNLIAHNKAQEQGGGVSYSLRLSGDEHRGMTCNTIMNNVSADDQFGGVHINRSTSASFPIERNTISGNSGYQFANGTANNLNAGQNYWGTTDANQIAQGIYDRQDTSGVGTVTFEPFITVPDPCAPTESGSSTLMLQSVNLAEGFNDQATRITIRGSGFATSPAPSVRLSGSAGRFDLTSVTAVSAASFAATVPANLPAGAYDLIVTNPNGRVGTLPNAFTVLAGDPVITQVLPNSGLNDRDNDIVVTGLNFAAGASVRLGTTDLATSRVNGTSLLAVVPAGLSPGSYDLTVTNPGGGQAQLAAAYTVLNEESSNDLTGSNQDLWLDPEVPRAGSSAQVGLFVHRQGGTATLENVTVEFRRDSSDGELLGRGTVPFLDPVNGVESTTPVEVTFPNAGTVEIYAIIDPDTTVTESNEDNNVVHRTVVVAPAADDRTVPLVQGIAINGTSGATVDTPDVTVDISAADPDPNPTGMQAINVIEYVYNTSVDQWIPVKQSGWLPYDQTPARTQWQLLPLPGMHYLQVRARDNADNISIGNARQLVNYAPAKDTIGRRQTRVYRYTVPDGQSLTVNLEVVSGDADLYVWSSRTDQSARVSNLEDSANEQVSVPAAQVAPGVYQVEVYGYTAAEYRITTNVGPAQAALQAELTVGGVSPSKTRPDTPVVPVDSLPDERQGAAPALTTEESGTIYLPLVVR